MHGPRGWRLASYAAAQSAVVLLMVAVGLCGAGWALGRQLFRYSDIMHAFMSEIMHVDLLKLEVDLALAGSEVMKVSKRGVYLSLVLLVASVANWIMEMRLA